jgi:hypothetical protein
MIKRIGIFIGLFLAALVIASCKSGGSVNTLNDMTAKARNVVTSMSKSDYASATKDFDAKMKGAFTPDVLKKVWAMITVPGSKLKGFGEARAATERGYDEVLLKCNFDNGNAELKFVFNDQKQISGMWMVESHITGNRK